MVGQHGWKIDHLPVVTASLHPKVDDNYIYITLHESWSAGLNAPTFIVRLKQVLYGLKQAPQIWHNSINTFVLSFKQ